MKVFKYNLKVYYEDTDFGEADADSATVDKQLKISDGVNGTVVWMAGDSSANVTFAGTLASGAITSSGEITAYSDMNLKTDIKTIPNALDKVSDLRGV